MRAITTSSLLTALLLVGCSTSALPLSPDRNTGLTGQTGIPLTAGSLTPFVPSSASAGLSSTTQVSTPTDAKALAVNDESMVEGASALMEQDESNLSAMYSVASYGGRSGGYGGYYGGNGGDDEGGSGGYGSGGSVVVSNGGSVVVAQEGRNGGTVVVSQGNGDTVVVAQGRGFGRFGGGMIVVVQQPRITRQPAPPERGQKFDRNQRSNFSDCYQKDQQQRQTFTQAHPSYSSDEQTIQKILNAQTWQPNPDDPNTVMKSGSESLTLSDKTSRKIAVLRVIDSQAPHELVHGQIDIADQYADTSSKTVHWESTLQADGTRTIVFHEEYVTSKGLKWVTDWGKTQGADGSLSGTGTFTQTDASGKVISTETLTIGGAEGQGETIGTPATDTASPTPMPVDSPVATAMPTPTATAEATATAEPSPSATDTSTASGTSGTGQDNGGGNDETDNGNHTGENANSGNDGSKT